MDQSFDVRSESAKHTECAGNTFHDIDHDDVSGDLTPIGKPKQNK